MKTHRFEQTQILPIPVEEAWEFFCDPKNLDEMTPSDLGFETLFGNDERMFPGQIIVHRIELAPLVRVNWTTEISQVVDGEYFIDEQRSGPYRFWHHLHRFESADGGKSTRMLDRVHYALPFFPFGEVGLPLVRGKLEKIFGFRREFLEGRFESTGSVQQTNPVHSLEEIGST
ncbi:MAG: SRPBCC family protein [Verrucomicrobiales bacterium]|nr:SRPBCC family protein [Verrucomicrobiales bacterium]